MAWRPPESEGRDSDGIITRDPDKLIELEYIPAHMLRLIPPDKRPGRVTCKQRTMIRTILNMRSRASFRRCRGQDRKKVVTFEEQGDFTHSGYIAGTVGYDGNRRSKGGRSNKRPPECGFCEKCRCSHVAGLGTKGNFYGIGPSAGLYGVGLCSSCIFTHRVSPRIVLLNARRELEALSAYGEVGMDSEYALREIDKQNAIVVAEDRLHEETRLLAEEIGKVRREIESGEAFEYNRAGVQQPLCTKSRVKMLTDLAMARSRLRINDDKLSDDAIKMKYLIPAVKAIEQEVRGAIAATCELTSRKTIGDDIGISDPIEEYVWARFTKAWARIWQELKEKAESTKLA
jgi:hypothetical protein